MTRLGATLLLGVVALGGCARHGVVERAPMRLDPARGTGSLSDPEWIVLREPRGGEEPPEPDPL